MYKRSMWFIITICSILSMILVFSFMVVPSLDNQINWIMYGTLMDSNGNPISTTEFTISGSFHNIDNDNHELNLRIVFPDTFQYMYDREYEPHSTYLSIFPKQYDLQYFMVDDYSFNRTANKSVKSSFALCHKNEYAIFHWDDGTNLWLVASTDPNADPQEILQFFQLYRQIYSSKN